MRRNARNLVGVVGSIAVIAALLAAFAASSASAITITNFEAGTCTLGTCTYAGPASSFYAQAAGHPPFGVTDFSVGGVEGTEQAKRVKVELPQGLNVNPQAVTQCAVATFKTNEAACAGSKVGTSEVTTTLLGLPITLPFSVYDLVPNNGEPGLFGFHVTTPLVPLINEFVYLETAIEWAGDYHESFTINNIEAFPALARNRLIFEGTAGGSSAGGSFLTLPSPCNGASSSKLELEADSGAKAGPQSTTPPVPIANCAAVPFKPTVTASASGPTDSSTPVTVALNIPQHLRTNEVNS
jgi:hypothetical protein